ncbi:MAG TPA: glycosyltransferase family 4 protein, partial [Planctomycetaceae bacterium]
MHIALITAGGAGMFCGSCMHDNTLARALIAAGHEVSLIPTYTPIRVDETNVSTQQVFLGGINVYLDAMLPGWRFLPRVTTRWLDSPAIINLVTRFGISSNARKLGRLTVALLEGSQGPEAREIDELVRFLGHLKPDVVCFSNALLAGVLPSLKQHFSGKICCLLQGDDIFLDDLIEPFRQQALQLLRGHARLFDGFLVHSGYYRDFMAAYLELPLEKMHVVPLGIDLTGYDGLPAEAPRDPFTIGYFARICPEKGLHLLVDAFRIVHQQEPRARLVAAGYLGQRDQAYFDDLARRAADLGEAFRYIGSPPGHVEKVTFLKSLDVLSVPTIYREPKGLYVLEALANGVPVVQPRHGSFPELIEATGGGLLVEPNDPRALADALRRLMDD